MAQLVKNLPTTWETGVQSLGWEDPLKNGKGYPLQYSGLENSMDCIVLGVTKSRTQLSGFHFHLRFFLFLWCQFDFFFISDFIDLDSFS